MCIRDRHNREVIIESFQWEEVVNYQLCMKRTRTLLDQYPDVDGTVSYTHLDVYKRQLYKSTVDGETEN